MSTEAKAVSKAEEPKMCTKKEQIGHAIGVLGHDAAYNLWNTWMMPFFNGHFNAPSTVYWRIDYGFSGV